MNHRTPHRTPRWPAAIAGATAALCLGLALAAPANARAIGNSGDGNCTTASFTGDTTDGNWHRTFNPNCSGNTVATINIAWHNYRATNGDEHFKYQTTISTAGIANDNCVEVALDPNPPNGMHGDAQDTRNCYENSTYTTPWVDIDLQPRGDYAWPIQRLQVSVYDPGAGTVDHKACPNGGMLTDTDTGCNSWNPDASWSSLGAKIFRKTNAGTEQQNQPIWSTGASDYAVAQFVSANQ